MRKLIFLIPLLLAPALGSAAHRALPVQPAYDLKVAAAYLNRQVSHLRGNKPLKREARQFLRASNQLVKETRRARRPRQVARTLDRLNYQFLELRWAAIGANAGPRKRKNLRRQIRRVSRALSRAESALTRNSRYARSWSNSGYKASVRADNRYGAQGKRRYRH